MSEQNKRKDQTPSGFHKAVPVILVAVAIFITLCFFTQNTGTVGRLFASLLMGLFAGGAYLIPVLLLIHAIFYISDIEEKRLLSRVIFSLVALVTLSCVIYTFGAFGKDLPFTPLEYYASGVNGIGGGFIGSVLAFGIMKIFGGVGLIIIALMIFALYITFFFSKERNVFLTLGIKLLSLLLDVACFVERRIKTFSARAKARRERRRNSADNERREELFADDFFATDTALSRLEIKELGILEGRESDAIEANPTLQEKVYPKSATNSSAVKKEFSGVSYQERKKTVSFDAEDELLGDTRTSDKAAIVYDDPQSASLGGSSDIPALDQSADAVFTRNFDPFDIAVNEALSKKASSKAQRTVESPTVREELSSVIEEQRAARARREEFEKRRAALIENAKRSSSASAFGFGAESVREITSAPKKAAEPVAEPPKTASVEKSIAFSERETEIMHTDEAKTPFSATFEKPEMKTDIPLFTSSAPRADAPAEPHGATKASAQGTVFTFGEAVEENIPKEPTRPTGEPTVFTFGEDNSFAEKDEQTNEKPHEDTPAAEAPAITQEQAPVFQEYAPERELVSAAVEEEVAEELSIERERLDSELYLDTEEGDSDEDEETALEETPYPEDDEEETEDEPLPIPPEEQNPEIISQRSMFSFLKEEDAAEKEDAPPFEIDEDSAESEVSLDTVETDETDDVDAEDTPFYEPRSVNSKFNDFMNSMRSQTKEKIREVEQEQEKKTDSQEAPDYSDYKFPSIDMLVPGQDEGDSNINAEIQENAEKLIDTLSSFRVSASIKGVDSGPRITRYEVVPARGVKVSAVTSLFDDISLALAAPGIRMEAPIPGKSAIGFEIPNQKPKTVRLRDLIEAEEFQTARSKTYVAIGKDVTGNPVFGDIGKMPHVLIAGATGMGKSVCINAIMISLLFRSRPDEVKFIMIDPKKVEFNGYNGIPHLLVPVVTEPKQAAGALMWAVEEMDKRFDDIEKLRVKKIDDYNEKVKADPSLGTPMPRIIIVIDELNDLMLQVRDPVENLIMRIAQKARAAGIHLIIGTQRPSVNVITGVIKANIPSRMSCKVSSSTDSRTILEQTGAEKLLNNGDMLFWPVGKPKPIRVQGAFVSDDEVENIMDFLRAQAKGDIYNNEVMDQINRAAQKCSKHGSDDDDDDDDDDTDVGEGFLNDQKFLDAVNLTLNAGRVATSFLQRKLEIGYGRAAKYMDIMEDLGIIGEKNGQKPRDVLITKQDWNEMLARRSLD